MLLVVGKFVMLLGFGDWVLVGFVLQLVLVVWVGRWQGDWKQVNRK